ncbi:hypothetical protein L1049_002031 [Liquidambar formosana]|uniref:Uncharacterized protein n=1 Tax=Liquidambar formosana TaxID=63359 RepID=A0AAP0NEW6_LIQFO
MTTSVEEEAPCNTMENKVILGLEEEEHWASRSLVEGKTVNFPPMEVGRKSDQKVMAVAQVVVKAAVGNSLWRWEVEGKGRGTRKVAEGSHIAHYRVTKLAALISTENSISP